MTLCALAIYALLAPVLEARHDAIVIDGQRAGASQAWHGWSAAVRGLVFVALALLAFGLTCKALALTGLLSAWYWIAFDTALNRFRSLAWDYVGEVDAIDLFLRRLHSQGVHPAAFKTFVLLTFALAFLLC